MAEPAIHRGDLPFDPDACSCANLLCTSATPPSTCQAWEPEHGELALCLGLMLDQFRTRHAESSASSPTSSMVSMHLPKT